jgi:hypothetical protein
MTPEELNSLKSQGFIVSTSEDPDFFDLLLKQYLETSPTSSKNTAAAKKELKAISDFIEFSKRQLLKNPPVTMTFLDKGMALQFADYSRVILVDSAKITSKNNIDVAINSTGLNNREQQSFRQVDTSVPITR